MASSSTGTDPMDLEFARLVPLNLDAQTAFHELVELIKSGSLQQQQFEKFMHIDTQQKLLPSWSDSDTENTGSEVLETDAKSLWTGYYRLDFDTYPSKPRVGWFIGGIDGDLALTSRNQKFEVRRKHAVLGHSSNLCLMLKIAEKRKVIIGTREVAGPAERHMNAMETILTFGKLTYRLEQHEMNEAIYRSRVAEMKVNVSKLPPSFNPAPSPRHMEITGKFSAFSVQTPYSSGTFGTISAGTQLDTGVLVAIKRVRKTTRNIARLETECEVYRRIQKSPHPNLCNLLEIIPEDTESRGSIDDIHIVHTPLAVGDFTAFQTSEFTTYDMKLGAVHQWLKGLDHFHKHGIMHRDVKPDNLMIEMYDPLRVVIIDYGAASTSPTSCDHMQGTIAYLAPEVMSMKRQPHNPSKYYDNRVDIWSLGLCAYQLFLNKPCTWSEVNETVYNRIMKQLSLYQQEISIVIQIMLSWDAPDRRSAEKLLKHRCWPIDNENPKKRMLEDFGRNENPQEEGSHRGIKR